MTREDTATIGPSVLNWPSAVERSETIRVVFVTDGGSPTTLATYGPVMSDTPTDTEAPTSEVVARNQLIARWPFEDGFTDVVGNNDASADYGSPTPGTYGDRRAVGFDGNDGLMIDRGPNPDLSIMEAGSGPACVGGWIYLNTAYGSNVPDGRSNHYRIFRNTSEWSIRGEPTDSDGESKLYMIINGQDGGTTYSTRGKTDGEMTVSTTEWHHIFFVVSPQEYLKFYLNGEERFHEDSMGGHSPTVPDRWADETIGGAYGGNPPDWYFLMDGYVSDVRIYDTALTDEQITRIYANTR